ncbi:zinc finger protein VAR3, chloroplastic-like [Rutidosis leptorrhynchoides]|uniref:zinc finger protein VAR3, chloroplastic-like n=1 Tax=Rutidosis leptorrhynchoides TaxID=125765 RepID=UPI003A99BFE7
MTGASSRFLFLLTNSISFLHHRPSTFFRLAGRRPLTTLTAANNHHHLHHSHKNSLIPVKFTQNYCSRATNYSFEDNNHVPANERHVSPSHPWPEWSRLLESLYNSGYFDRKFNAEDDSMTNENLSFEFVDAANSCLAFARDRPDILRWLPRRDIEVLINDGYPFLFKSAEEIEIRMRSFVQVEGSNEATLVDLMKYILSYVSNFNVSPERNVKEATESCVRRLLQEMATNITMKRGDWICAKCNFMNFAKNTKCLECEELRPQSQLTNGEWYCPRCNFFNYRKNVVCLKCECRRPNEAGQTDRPIGQTDLSSDKEEKIDRWFKKIKDLHGLADQTSDTSHDELLIRNEKDRFVDNKMKDQQFSSYRNQRQHSMEQGSTSSFAPFVPFPPDYFAKKDDPKNTDTTVKPSYTNNATVDKNFSQGTEHQPIRSTDNLDSRSYVSNRTIYSGETNSDSYSNQFRRNDFNPEGNRTLSSGNQFTRNEPKPEGDRTSNQFSRNEPRPAVSRQVPESMNAKSGWTGKSLEGSAVTEPDPLDMSEEAKAERWFKRVAQIKDISELSQIPDEDFPSIMPMRKGVNRFVVSKRKTPLERRLTSPQYRKNLRIVSSDPIKKDGDDDN